MDRNYNSICILSWLGLLILTVLVHENARIPSRIKKRFYMTYLLIGIALFAEWGGLQLNGKSDEMMPYLRLVKCADYIFSPMIGGALVTQLGGRRRLWSRLLALILMMNTILQVLGCFHGWVFYINENNCYTRGPFFNIYLILSLVVALLVTLQFFDFGRNYRRKNQNSLYLILILFLVAITMQEILPGSSRTLYIGLTLASALLFIHFTEFSQLAADDYLNQQLIKVNTDALTGLLSRHAYSQALNEYNAMKALPECFGVISIDVNGLKHVNDTLGHEAGDELILGAAQCIKDAVGQQGKCYRTGGDEFVVLLNTDLVDILRIIQKLQKNTQSWHGMMVDELHLATGYAISSDHPGMLAEKLVNEADMAMYAAKSAYYKKNGLKRSGYE